MHWIDPASLPETESVVASFLLEGGTEVHVPPHMAAGVIAAVRAGSTVRVRGVRPRGVLLKDGRAGRFPPHAAQAIAPLLLPGNRLAVSGDGTTTDHGTVIAISRIGSSQADMRKIEAKPKGHGPRKPKKAKPKHPPGHGRHHGHDLGDQPAA